MVTWRYSREKRGPRALTHSYPEALSGGGVRESADDVHHVQCHVAHFVGVAVLLIGGPGHYHVSVAYGLHLTEWNERAFYYYKTCKCNLLNIRMNK